MTNSMPSVEAPQNQPPDSERGPWFEKLKAKLQQIDTRIVAGVFAGVLLIASLFVRVMQNGDPALGGIVYGQEYEASAEEVGAVDETIENGFLFDPGPPATDTTDYDTYELPETTETLNARLIEVMNTSPAFEGVDSIYELLEYDDFDNQGNVKESTIRSLIEIGESALE